MRVSNFAFQPQPNASPIHTAEQTWMISQGRILGLSLLFQVTGRDLGESLALSFKVCLQHLPSHVSSEAVNKLASKENAREGWKVICKGFVYLLSY